MKKIIIQESSFLPGYSLKGDIFLPEVGMVLVSGENGIGKSTLCRYLYDRQLLGEEIVWIESNQFRSIYPLTVESVLQLFLASAHSLNQDRFQQLYSLFKIKEWNKRIWGELSSGQGQMLKLIMGLSVESRYFLLDEPVHFLDQDKLNGLSDFLKDLMKSSLIILVDHRHDWFKGEILNCYHLRKNGQEILLEKRP